MKLTYILIKEITDVAAFMNIQHEIAQNNSGADTFYPEDDSFTLRYFREGMRNDTLRCWHAVSDKGLVGMVICGKNSENPSEGVIDTLYIAPEYRGHRLSRQLLAHAEQDLMRQNFSACAVYFGERGHNVQAFYEKQGWTAEPDKTPSILRFVKTLQPAQALHA